MLGVPLDALVPRLRGLADVLILEGEQDDTADPTELARIAAAAGGRFVGLPGDHNFLLTAGEPATSMIRAFLAGS